MPAPVSTLTPFERFASEAVHKALYVLMVLVPLLGWAGVSAYIPRGASCSGCRCRPSRTVNESLAKVLLELHGWAALALAGLIVRISRAR